MLHILVVDDDRDTTEAMRILLKLWGFVVLTANTGAGAVKAADIFPPDVVLLDLGLPGMDGLAVARQIRQFGGKQPVIIAISSHGQDEDRRRAREAGCDHFLLKPLDPDELKTLLQALEAVRHPHA